MEEIRISYWKKMLPWMTWGLGAAFFFIQYIARVSPSVMTADLMSSFNVGAFALGGLSAFFYYAYVPMQLPVGMLIDRFGTRRLLIISTAMAAFGCYMFATAHSLYMAEVGRLLLGFGSAFGFISGIKLAAVWFPPERFGMLSGITQALGMVGAVVGEMPVAFSVNKIGWRHSMWLITALFIILMVLIILIVQDRPKNNKAHESIKCPPVSLMRSLIIVAKNKRSWFNAMYVGMMYAAVAAFGELWGVSYLGRVYHLSADMAATASSAIFVGWAMGAPILGWLSDKMGKRTPLMKISSIISCALIVAILYAPLSHWLLFVALFSFGVVNAGAVLAYVVAGEINSKRVAGTSVAFSNMASVLFGMLLQPVIGWLMDVFWSGQMRGGVRYYSVHDYHWSMFVLVICSVLAVVFSFTVEETNCRNIADFD